ncbi:MAG: AAA family ATPase [Rubrivivax sp.]|nr:AAA family ATPase [Rubrivivax sp.]
MNPSRVSRGSAPQAPPDDGPTTIQMEQALCGALLQDADTAGPELQRYGVTPQHCEDPRNAAVLGAIAVLIERKQPVDLFTVFDLLGAMGAAERAGGMAYLHQLECCVPSARNAGRYAEIVAERAAQRRITTLALAVASSPAVPQLRADLLAELAQVNGLRERAPVVFAHVPLADLHTAEPQPQQWWWDGYVPAGHVTLWSGHGGAGKSTLALMLLACMAMGRTFLGKGTRRGKLLFFSAEDPGQLVRLRLRRVCTVLDVDPAALAERLRVIDATELDAALYVEQRIGGVRHGATTPTYEALRQYIEAEGIDVLVLDNASDLFDGDEIVRTLVRGFIRSLAHLVRQRGGAAVLLAHVDKGTSRAGKGASSESYSGSTGWHNSVRSRLVLLEKEPGTLELQHQKCNLGPKQAPVVLTWPEGGLPTMVDPDLPPPDAAARPNADAAMRALVALIREHYALGRWVSTSKNSTSSASKLFAADARYPRHLKPSEVEQLLFEAQRARFIEAEPYKNEGRKHMQRWRVTTAGVAMVDNLPLFATGASGCAS